MTTGDDPAVGDYIASIDDEPMAKDTETVIELMRRISGKSPKLWNVGTIGFGEYHYKYESGREGDAMTIGFYPRKGRITVYMMDGTARYTSLLANLGKHSETGYCVYIKRLADVDLPTLEQILTESWAFIEAKAAAGPITHILWKSEE